MGYADRARGWYLTGHVVLKRAVPYSDSRRALRSLLATLAVAWRGDGADSVAGGLDRLSIWPSIPQYGLAHDPHDRRGSDPSHTRHRYRVSRARAGTVTGAYQSRQSRMVPGHPPSKTPGKP